jgi:hypothetical protein
VVTELNLVHSHDHQRGLDRPLRGSSQYLIEPYLFSNCDSQVHYLSSPDNALLTSDREIPNSRAIRTGVRPALNDARTAFNFPCDNETAPVSLFPSALFRHSSLFAPFQRAMSRQSRKNAQRIAQTNLSNVDDTDRLPVIAAAFSQGWIAFRNK